jgi:hypothetical protein
VTQPRRLLGAEVVIENDAVSLCASEATLQCTVRVEGLYAQPGAET